MFFLLIFQYQTEGGEPLPRRSIYSGDLGPARSVKRFYHSSTTVRRPTNPTKYPLLPFVSSGWVEVRSPLSENSYVSLPGFTSTLGHYTRNNLPNLTKNGTNNDNTPTPLLNVNLNAKRKIPQLGTSGTR